MLLGSLSAAGCSGSALTSAGEEEEIDLLSVLEGASKPERVVKEEPREARTACGMVARHQDPVFRV